MSNISNLDMSNLSKLNKSFISKWSKQELYEKSVSHDPILFSGSEVEEGSCLAIVCAVGNNTALWRAG